MSKTKTKKIYKYVDRLIKRCDWCRGTGRNLTGFVGQECAACNGRGGEWERVRELVGEEVIS